MTGELKEVAGVEIVFESVTEDSALKRELIKKLESVVSANCILATNTSAIPVSLLQENARHPERILRHRGNVFNISLLSHRIGAKSHPSFDGKSEGSFITNRISYAMFREACHLVDSGVYRRRR